MRDESEIIVKALSHRRTQNGGHKRLPANHPQQLGWLLAEFGLIGALAFFVPAIRIAAQELRRFRSNDTAGYLLLLIIAGFGAMSLFHELLYQRTMWFLLGLGLAVIKQPHRNIRVQSAPVERFLS